MSTEHAHFGCTPVLWLDSPILLSQGPASQVSALAAAVPSCKPSWDAAEAIGGLGVGSEVGWGPGVRGVGLLHGVAGAWGLLRRAILFRCACGSGAGEPPRRRGWRLRS